MAGEFGGLEVLDIIKLVNKKKRRFCKIALDDLEMENLTPEQYKAVRKIFLDNMNAFARSMFIVLGIEIEGLDEE